MRYTPSGGQPLGSSLSRRLSSEGSGWGGGEEGGGGGGGGGRGGSRRLEVIGGRAMWQRTTNACVCYLTDWMPD